MTVELLCLYCVHAAQKEGKQTVQFKTGADSMRRNNKVYSLYLVCCICYLELCWISAIHHYLSGDVTKKLLCVFVLLRLDYYNSLLAGCPKYLLSKLQKVQNSVARLIFRITRSAHVIPMIHSLHWLPTEQRIEYKLSFLCLRSFLIRLPSTF